MAFNPFHGFRKHSKVIFAILTIICMITFILSSGLGRGDFFDWLVGLVGAGKKGEVYTTLYGSKVYHRDLQERRSRREIANELMQGVALESVQPTMARVKQELGKLYDGELSEELRLYRDQLRDAYLRQNVLSFGQAPETEEFLKFLGEKDLRAHDILEMVKQIKEGKSSRQTLQRLEQSLQPNPFGLYITRTRLLGKDRTEEARVLAGLMTLDENEALFSRDPRTRVTYFDKSTQTQDLLDSLVWLHQADTLGIRLTEEGIRAEVNRISPAVDILTGDSKKDRELVQRLFANRDRRAQVDLAAVYAALSDELRIRLAKETILGEVPGQRHSLASLFGEADRSGSVYRPFTAVTPGDYLDYYRGQRTSVKATLLPLPVRAFVDDIPRQPTAKELEKLFTDGKSVESQPWSRTLGFKRPHKVGLQWITREGASRTFAVERSTFGQTWTSFREIPKVLPLTGALRALRDPREEHYLHLAEDLLSIGRNSVPLTGLPGPALSLPAPPVPGSLLGVQGLLDRAYRNIRLDHPVPSLFGGDPALAYYTALEVPSTVASLVAQAAPSGPANSYFSTLVGSQAAVIWRAREYKDGKVAKDFQQEAIKEEVQKRAGVVASATAFSLTSPSVTGLGPWLWANAQQPPQESRDLPFSEDPPLNYVSPNGLRFAVREEATHDLADKLFQQDLSQLVEDLKKTSNDREAFEKVLREARKHRPWWDNYTGKTSDAVDRYTFLTAPELLPLRNLLGVSPAQSTEEQLRAIDRFFDSKESKLYDPQSGPNLRPDDPQSGRNLIWWRTQAIAATTPSWGDPGVRQEVVEAWQMIEARKVAQQEAKRIRERIDGKNADEALKELRKLAKEHPSWGSLIRLEEVARQVPKPDTQQRPGKEYEPYKVPRDQIPYPPENFVDRLLELNEHQAGFLSDRPEKHVYVVYVEKRSPPPSVEQVVEARRRELEREKLWEGTKTKQQKEHQEAVLRELRREAGKLNAEGRFELQPGIRPDEGGSDREGYSND